LTYLILKIILRSGKSFSNLFYDSEATGCALQPPDVPRGNQIEIYRLTLFGFLFMPQDKGQKDRTCVSARIRVFNAGWLLYTTPMGQGHEVDIYNRHRDKDKAKGIGHLVDGTSRTTAPQQLFQSPLIYVNLDIYVPHCGRRRNSISPRLHGFGSRLGRAVFFALRHMLGNYNLLSL